MTLSLYVTSTICEPLISQPISACVMQCPQLLRLELADSSSADISMLVDMLTGANYYWQLMIEAFAGEQTALLP